MKNLLRDIGLFIRAVFWKWQNWAGGSGIGGAVVVFIGIWEHAIGQTMGSSLYISIIVGAFLFAAFFMAWRAENRKVRELEHPEESPYSLRRRAVQLADEIDLFYRRRYDALPDMYLNEPESQTRRQDHEKETFSLCKSLYMDKVRSIAMEMEGKGVDTHAQWNWSLSDIDFEPRGSHTALLRHLAYRLDHADSLVRF
jgi:hypothetical protein